MSNYDSSIRRLSQQSKADRWKSIPPFQRDARSKGVPALGAGRDLPGTGVRHHGNDFEIPAHWPHAYGRMWSGTARRALGRDQSSVPAPAIRARGAWIRGAIDPAARGRSQVDGRQPWQMYADLGLKLDTADNAVDAGIYRVWQRLSPGLLKVFKSLSQWFAEFRPYRRDEKGKVVKERGHGLDATRYLCIELLNICRTEPPKREGLEFPFHLGFGFGVGGAWMG